MGEDKRISVLVRDVDLECISNLILRERIELRVLKTDLDRRVFVGDGHRDRKLGNEICSLDQLGGTSRFGIIVTTNRWAYGPRSTGIDMVDNIEHVERSETTVAVDIGHRLPRPRFGQLSRQDVTGG